MISTDDLQKIIMHTIRLEGGYSDRKEDKGGATNLGISWRFLKDAKLKCLKDMVIDKEFIKNLTPAVAYSIYVEAFWSPFLYCNIHNLMIAAKAFDMCVNMGSKQAHKLIQRAVNTLIPQPLLVDGILGLKSIAEINGLIALVAEAKLFDAIKDQCIAFYNLLVSRDPTQQVNLKGWINRAKSSFKI